MKFSEVEPGQSVQWTYKDRSSLKTAIGIVYSKSGTAATINLDSGRSVNIPVEHLTLKDAFSEAGLTGLVMGRPNDRQMAKINQYLPRGAEPLEADDLISIPFIVADNLVNRGLDAWDVASLKKMAKILPGIPFTLDHNWEDTSKEWGRIYSAELINVKDPGAEIYDRAGNKDSNLSIIQTDGLYQVAVEVFAPADSPVVKALAYGHSGSVSTGGFQFTDYNCPICKTSFYDKNCPHIPPSRWMLSNSEPDIAPYSIRVGLFDMGEVSIVLMPNLPNAGIIR